MTIVNAVRICTEFEQSHAENDEYIVAVKLFRVIRETLQADNGITWDKVACLLPGLLIMPVNPYRTA